MEDAFLATLVARYGNEGLRVGTPPEPIAIVPAKHPEVGDLKLWNATFGEGSERPILHVNVAVGDTLCDDFTSFDTHLPIPERVARVANDVIRFLDHLFSDRLLFWKSIDRAARRGWRERGTAGHVDPLVLDDRTYRTYLWSGPLGTWRATSRVLTRGRIVDEREYEIVRIRLQHGGAEGFDEPLSDDEREHAAQLVARYEREHDV